VLTNRHVAAPRALHVVEKNWPALVFGIARAAVGVPVFPVPNDPAAEGVVARFLEGGREASRPGSSPSTRERTRAETLDGGGLPPGRRDASSAASTRDHPLLGPGERSWPGPSPPAWRAPSRPARHVDP
jgi:hypothetical protein